jgi:hypothetical protein
VVGAPCFSRGEQRFSVAQRSWTLITRFSAGVENSGLKCQRKPLFSESDLSKLGSAAYAACFVSGHDFSRAAKGREEWGFSPCLLPLQGLKSLTESPKEKQQVPFDFAQGRSLHYAALRSRGQFILETMVSVPKQICHLDRSVA